MRRFCVIALAALCACSGRKPAPQITAPPLLIDSRGTTMPLERAIVRVGLVPYIPAQALSFAVLPPLGGLDTRANRGFGVEYQTGHNAMLLSEWPRQRFAIAFGVAGVPRNCVPVHYSTTNVAWTTPRNLVMTLQPDGPVGPSAVDREALRLVRSGACR
jgi:hypothetical protein